MIASMMRGTDLGARLTGAASIVALLALVELLVRTDVLSVYVIPLPSDILASFGRLVTQERLLQRFALTFGEALAAGIIVTIVGVLIGFALYRFPVVRAALESWVAAFSAAPLVLAYPLFMVIFGRSALTIIMLGFMAGLAPVILKTVEGLAGVRKTLLNVGHSFKLSPSKMFWMVQLPAAAPTIFVGIRLSLIFALINVVGLEFLINFGGLGQLINELAERYDLPGTYAAIIFVVIVSVIFFAAVERAERWLRPG
jgi:NitT/TauT family transport system permease protein